MSAVDADHEEPEMLAHDAEFLLSVHRTHAAELRGAAAADRLARSLPHRSARGWLSRRQHAGRPGDTRR
ncbi:hypothetical protein QTQ03_11070 [Micromonospora sp. WMMA1363]|uniref:hypothetical protein n=1 Tax=Micromonospora sp. WMMA1363 TaxID=3053985 RepID=UPI00259C95AE|nr:hypothetical protein [Micromonospora sp. WMMA1363]MDM4720093.1 hypothetical protein [Micromonospora sp. WMMA1363]